MKGHDTMGKDLKGKELGKGLSQRKDGKYSGRFVDRFGKRTQVYGSTLKEVKNKIAAAWVASPPLLSSTTVCASG